MLNIYYLMKKTFIFLLIVFTLLTNKLVFAQENDYDIYLKSVENKVNLSGKAVIAENEYYNEEYQKKIDSLASFSRLDESDKKNLTANLQSYSYGSNLLSNGNFELGHAYWNEWYKSSNGNWYDYDFIIQAGSGGYDSWYANVSQNEWLISYYNTTPNNTVDFRVSYNYRLMYWGTCSYGTNGIGVYLEDKTLNSFYVINAHDAETDPYNYSYTSTSFLVSSVASLSPVSNHDVYIEFLHINDDPNCTLAFYLDNVSVEPVIYVPDYTITTSAGSNGSITSGATIAQGGNYIVNITPNSGYEIFSVLVDGVDVGPVSYYNLNNIQTAHSVQANFSISSSPLNRVYRFWNRIDGRHLYTMDDVEMTSLINNDSNVWNYEGIAWKISE